jgi:hypothetical protein
MEKIFSVQDRQNAFEFVLSAARENDRITGNTLFFMINTSS